MQALSVLLFSTFVAASLTLSTAYAAKETPPPDLGDAVPAPPPPAQSTNPVEDTTLDLGPRASPPKSITMSDGPTYFHAYHNGFSLIVGALNNTSPETIATKSVANPAFAGLRLMGTTEGGMSLEAGADIMTDGTGELSFARRWISGQDSFRPYLKLGLGLWVNPEDQLAAFIDLEHFRLLGGAGFEVHVVAKQSFRFEIEGGLGWPTVHPYPAQVGAHVGWVWAW